MNTLKNRTLESRSACKHCGHSGKRSGRARQVPPLDPKLQTVVDDCAEQARDVAWVDSGEMRVKARHRFAGSVARCAAKAAERAARAGDAVEKIQEAAVMASDDTIVAGLARRGLLWPNPNSKRLMTDLGRAIAGVQSCVRYAAFRVVVASGAEDPDAVAAGAARRARCAVHFLRAVCVRGADLETQVLRDVRSEICGLLAMQRLNVNREAFEAMTFDDIVFGEAAR